jgi:hypothetical protein
VKIFKVKFYLIFLLQFLTSMAWSGEALNYRIRHSYISPRALGMGDAFVAVSDDYSSLYYNPAGLGRREDGEINMSLEGGLTQSFTSFVNDIQKASKTVGTDAQKQEAILNVIKNAYGSSYMIRTAPMSGVWVRPGWGLGVIPIDASVDLTVHNQVGPSVNLTGFGDTSVVFGLGKDVPWFSRSRTSIGATFKFTNRINVSRALAVLDLADSATSFSSNELREGYSVDADLGLLLTPELPSDGIWQIFRLAKPTFGFVLRNAGETGFKSSLKLANKSGQTLEPEKNYRVLDVGMKWEYPSVFIFGGRGVLDVRDIMHPLFTYRKAVHVGFEFDWRMFSWWKGQYRIGMNQGYLTAGLSALFTVFNLDLVTYGEDVGTYYSPKESRMYMLKMNMNF